jgi:hypothetical protein
MHWWRWQHWRRSASSLLLLKKPRELSRLMCWRWGSIGDGRGLGPFEFPPKPLTQGQAFRLVERHQIMQPLNFHHIQNPSARRSRIAQ